VQKAQVGQGGLQRSTSGIILGDDPQATFGLAPDGDDVFDRHDHPSMLVVDREVSNGVDTSRGW
jgi:hypothetical protein